MLKVVAVLVVALAGCADEAQPVPVESVVIHTFAEVSPEICADVVGYCVPCANIPSVGDPGTATGGCVTGFCDTLEHQTIALESCLP